MAVNLSPVGGVAAQFFTNTGAVLTGGKLYTYLAGTTTPTPTYTTSAGNVARTNPIVLDAAGRVPGSGEIWVTVGVTYKFVLTDSNDVLIGTYDNVTSLVNTDASLVTYTPAGTGAVTTTVQAKLRQYVSVKDFGATGNGSTDDTTAIQAALTAAGGIYFPKGTYKITATLVVSSNTFVFGDGDSTIIQIAANTIRAFDTGIASDKSNITIRDLLIDGGGQTSDIYTGYKSGIGISLYRCQNVLIDNVTVRKMGVIKSAGDPTDDGAYGGFGIIADCSSGDIKNIRINNCTVTNIASGGNFNGDGITVIGSYAGATSIAVVDVVVDGCYVSTVGRHCYTAEGLLANKLPESVKFVNCYAEKSALCGVDVEDARKVLVSNCTFQYCGNDQTYYNPAVAYGASYRLMAGVATTNDSQDVVVNNSTFMFCYFGYTFGASSRQTVSNCVFNVSTISDITQGTAGGAIGFSLVNCQFLSLGTGTNLNYYQLSDYSGFKAIGCVFNKSVTLSAMSNGEFQNCTFFNGVVVNAGTGEFKRNLFNACEFRDFNGIALTCSTSNAAQPDNIVSNCLFYGSGLLTKGIVFGFNSALRWKIIGNKFYGLLTAGIDHLNGNAQHTFDAIGNDFVSCAAGIRVDQALANSIISSNSFSDVSGTCIAITGILSSANMTGMTITNNTADSCVNGVNISVSTGTWDYSVVVGNNMHSCSGTRWSLSAGNANGYTINNVIT